MAKMKDFVAKTKDFVVKTKKIKKSFIFAKNPWSLPQCLSMCRHTNEGIPCTEHVQMLQWACADIIMRGNPVTDMTDNTETQTQTDSSSGSRGVPRGPWPPSPVQISHKKDGRQRQPHRFHVSWPPPHPAAGSDAGPCLHTRLTLRAELRYFGPYNSSSHNIPAQTKLPSGLGFPLVEPV